MSSDAQRWPQSIAHERAILGGIIGDSEGGAALLDRCLARGLSAPAFYRREHGALFGLLSDRVSEGQLVDLVAVPEAVARLGLAERVGGISYVVELPDHAPAAVRQNIEYYVDEVVADYRRRRIAEEIDAARQAALDGLVEPDRLADSLVDRLLTTATAASGSALGSWRRLDEVAVEVIDAAEHRQQHPGEEQGVAMGFRDLDEHVGGMHAGDLIVVAGRPAMGKSALAMQIAENVGRQGHEVAVFNLEMTDAQLAARAIAIGARTSAKPFRSNEWTGDSWSRVRAARHALGARLDRVWVDDTAGVTLADVRARLRRLQRHVGGKIGLIVVDYLQLVEGPDSISSREQQVAHNMRGLKKTAKEFQCPLIVLSQLSRKVEERVDKRPIMADLRESGSIEQDADTILFTFRPGYYQPESTDRKIRTAAEVIVAKGRHSGTGQIDLNFEESQARFFDLTDEQRRHGTAPPVDW